MFMVVSYLCSQIICWFRFSPPIKLGIYMMNITSCLSFQFQWKLDDFDNLANARYHIFYVIHISGACVMSRLVLPCLVEIFLQFSMVLIYLFNYLCNSQTLSFLFSIPSEINTNYSVTVVKSIDNNTALYNIVPNNK